MTPDAKPERRNAQARRAILDATNELIGRDGYAHVTIEGIAKAAEVGKTTIYRWWPSKGALTLEALKDRVGDAIDFPDTGDIRVDLCTQMTEVVRLLIGELGPVFRGLIGEAQSTSSTGAAILDTLVEPPTRACQSRLDSAIAAGQLRSDIPTRAMVEMIYGSMYYRLLLGTDPLHPQDVPGLIDNTLTGLRPRST